MLLNTLYFVYVLIHVATYTLLFFIIICLCPQALAQDQLRALLDMTNSLGVELSIGVYDGDTSREDRVWIRDNARLV